MKDGLLAEGDKEELLEFLKNYSKKISQEDMEEIDKKLDKKIKHLKKNKSLPSYVNKMFKQTSGLKPSDYTTEARSDWYNRVDKEISAHRERLTDKEQKRFKLDLLLRVAGRVDSLSTLCGKCQLFQQDILQLSRDLWEVSLMTKDQQKNVPRMINEIVKHLKKEHKLVTEGHYSAMWGGIGTAIGIGISAGLNAVTDSAGFGFILGIAIGMAVGKYLDKKAKTEGRVI